MNDYKNYHNIATRTKLQKTTDKLFDIQYATGEEGHEVTIDKKESIRAIIQKHVNPKNELILDKKMIYLREDKDKVHWGSLIESENLECPYLVVGRPEYNGMYASCLVRKANNQIKFSVGKETFEYNGVLHIGKLYLDQSYTNDMSVFAEEDKRALVIKYDKNTTQLSMFSEIVVDSVVYSVIKVDDCVLREYGSEYGVLQMVLLRQAPATLTHNFTNQIIGIMRYARLKERVYNSNSRELLTLPNAINTGDYITYKAKEDEHRTYIVRSMIDEFEDYDRTFILICQKEIKFLDKQGNIVNRPVSFNDNRTKMNEKDTWFVVQDTSAVEGYIRLDEQTAQLSYTDVAGTTDYVPNRFIIDGLAYRVVGTDRLSMDKLMTMKLAIDRIDQNYDNLELGIADYYRYYPKEQPKAPEGILGDGHIFTGQEGIYSLESPTNQPTKWAITPVLKGLVLQPLDNCAVNIKVKNDSRLKGKTVMLTCTTDTKTISRELNIVGW